MFLKMDLHKNIGNSPKSILRISGMQGAAASLAKAPFTHPTSNTMSPGLAHCQWNITGQRVVAPEEQGGRKYKQTTKHRWDGLK